MFGGKKRSKLFHQLSGSGFKNIDEDFVNALNNLDSVYEFSGEFVSALQLWANALAEVSRAGAAVASLLNKFYQIEDVRLTQLLSNFANHYDEKIVNFKTKKLVEMVQSQWIPNVQKFQNNLVVSFVDIVKERHEKQKSAEHYSVKVEKLKATDLANRSKGKIPTQKDREKLTRNEEKLSTAQTAYASIREEVNLKMNHTYRTRFQFVDDRVKDFVKIDFFFHDSVARSLGGYKEPLSNIMKQPIYRQGEASPPQHATAPAPAPATQEQPSEKSQDDEFAAFADFGERGAANDLFAPAPAAAPAAAASAQTSDASSDPFNLPAAAASAQTSDASSDPFNLGGSGDPFNLDPPNQAEPKPATTEEKPADPFNLGASADPFNLDSPKSAELKPATTDQKPADPFDLDSPKSADPFNLDPPKPAEPKPTTTDEKPAEFDPFQTTKSATSDPFRGATASDDPFSLGPPLAKQKKKPAEIASDDIFSLAGPAPAKAKPPEPKTNDPFDLSGFSTGPKPPERADDPFANIALPKTTTQEPDTSDPFSIVEPPATRAKSSAAESGSSDPFGFGSKSEASVPGSTEEKTNPFAISTGDGLGLQTDMSFGFAKKSEPVDLFAKAEVKSDPFSIGNTDPFAGLIIPGAAEPAKSSSNEPTNPFESFGSVGASGNKAVSSNPFNNPSSTSTNPFF